MRENRDVARNQHFEEKLFEPHRGDVVGRLRWVGESIPVLAWERELEVARREDGRLHLFGYQQ